jgi:hypothetical protein
MDARGGEEQCRPQGQSKRWHRDGSRPKNRSRDNETKKKSMEIQHGVATCEENPNRAQTNSNLYSQGAKAIIYIILGNEGNESSQIRTARDLDQY